MELSKIKKLYDAGGLTSAGVIFLAAEIGLVGPTTMVDTFGMSKACYYQALKRLENKGLMKTIRDPGYKLYQEDVNSPLVLHSTPQIKVSIAKI